MTGPARHSYQAIQAKLMPMGRPMNLKVLMITTVAMLAIGGATTARAGVVGPLPRRASHGAFARPGAANPADLPQGAALPEIPAMSHAGGVLHHFGLSAGAQPSLMR